LIDRIERHYLQGLWGLTLRPAQVVTVYVS